VHWVLDIAFLEDESRIRTGDADHHLVVLPHLALNLLQQEKTAKIGIKAKRLKAGWSNDKLTKTYGAKEVFRNISFQVERGQRLVVIGLNGAGKTTLLRTLLGITAPSVGKVTMSDRVRTGYYAQENEGLDWGMSIIGTRTYVKN
jgi:ATPase subunit of ABC transporter with duplicated ATPase domains